MVNSIFNLPIIQDTLFTNIVHPITQLFIETIKPVFNFSYSGYVISFFRIPIDIIYIIKKNYENEHSILGVIGNFVLMPADFGGAILFLKEILILDLAVLAEKLGKIPIVGLVAFIPLAPLVSILYISAYVILSINSILILHDNSKNEDERRQSLIDLATSISQIALALLFLVGYSYTPVLLVLGIVAGAIGAFGFIHRMILLN